MCEPLRCTTGYAVDMDDARRFQLLYGPYRAPRCRVGKRLLCKLRGTVKVTGISDGLIQWPQTRRQSDGRNRGGRPFLIVCGDLGPPFGGNPIRP